MGLPTETSAEVLQRWARFHRVCRDLESGRLSRPSDLVELNLNVTRFLLDAIEQSDAPEDLLAIFQAIRDIRVLDPACGSGAFLFSALNLLQPIYEACLDRMEVFVSEGGPSTDDLGLFHQTLEEVETHPNRVFTVLRSIMVRNLFGVDIIEEATETCKLRLYLKLMSQIDVVAEPLPDIDFNIQAGNSLVGYASRAGIESEVGGAGRLRTDIEDSMQRIDESLSVAATALAAFASAEAHASASSAERRSTKSALETALDNLRAEFDQSVAAERGVDPHGPEFDEVGARTPALPLVLVVLQHHGGWRLRRGHRQPAIRRVPHCRRL